jgi:hypothetical protein
LSFFLLRYVVPLSPQVGKGDSTRLFFPPNDWTIGA